MVFITATWTSTKKIININVAHIVSVTTVSNDTVIYTSVPSTNGIPYGYYVEDSIADIMNKIDSATR